MRTAFRAACLVSSLLSARALATPVTVDAILAAFRGVPGLEAHFREEKRLAVLVAPLISEGQIYFAPPNRLAKRVATPAKSAMLIDGNGISFQDEHGSQTLLIDTYPVARLFIDGFMQILAGNTEALRRLYEIALEAGPDGAWDLRFKPKGPPLSDVVETIELAGRGILIDTLRVSERGGDVTVTRFSAVDPSRRFTADELHRLFALDTR
jgi:hypothetical protein